MSSQNSDPYQQYLKELHSKITTTEDIIAKVVKEGTGKKILSKRRILAGEQSEVYNLVLANNSEVIMRISRVENPDYLQEKWAIDHCRKLGIPVPEILFIKHLPIDQGYLSFCIQVKMEGQPLEEIDRYHVDKSLFKKLTIEAGEILSKIHSIKTTGWGWLDGNGQGQFNSVEELLQKEVNRKDVYLPIFKVVDLDIKLIDKVNEILEKESNLYQKMNPFLCHGDYSPKHFMVKDERIVGILDFGGARSDSPVYDFAWWDYWFEDDLPTDWLKEGYQNKQLFKENFDQILHLIRLFRGLNNIKWYFDQGYKPHVDEAKIKLIKDLEYFNYGR